MRMEQITNSKKPSFGRAVRPTTSLAARALRAFLIAGCAATFAVPAAYAASGPNRHNQPDRIASSGPDENTAACHTRQVGSQAGQSTACAAKSTSASGDRDDQQAWSGTTADAQSSNPVPGSLSARGHDHR